MQDAKYCREGIGINFNYSFNMPEVCPQVLWKECRQPNLGVKLVCSDVLVVKLSIAYELNQIHNEFILGALGF